MHQTRLLSSKFAYYRDEIVRQLKERGYEFCGWGLFNAADFGVPQARLRPILVAMKPEYVIHFRWLGPEAHR